MDVVWRFLKGATIFLVVAALTACEETKQTTTELVEAPQGTCASSAVPNRFIVHWKDGSTTIEEADNREALIEELLEPNKEDIEFAEHDQVIRLSEPGVISSASPTEDPNWGQEMIKAPSAWERGIDGSGVIVAVIDSGADVTHPQLRDQIAVNTAEIPDNGIDDDGNGLIDDVYGFDFNEGTGKIKDGSGHGTHVSGVILADHATGSVKGVAPKAKLLPLDFMNDNGAGGISDAILAIKYAAFRGAKIINASWGGAPCSKSLKKAIQELEEKGVLFVAASGNGDSRGRGIDLGFYPSYPAAFVLGSQITVGASTKLDFMAGFSNYGVEVVNLLAPGVSILSTFPGNQAIYMDGTSMATPFVSGVAALLWSYRPRATVQQIKRALLVSAEPKGYPVSSRGRLDVQRALDEITRLVP